MPFDRSNGEVLDGLPASVHVVVDYRPLAAMTNLLVEYQVPNKKFGITTRKRPLFDDVMAIAACCFAEAGALLPITFDEGAVLVQVYPKESKVAVVVQRKIAGEDHYVTRDYDLPRSVIQHLLVSSGKAMPIAH